MSNSEPSAYGDFSEDTGDENLVHGQHLARRRDGLQRVG
jgi:hypothetical protein